MTTTTPESESRRYYIEATFAVPAAQLKTRFTTVINNATPLVVMVDDHEIQISKDYFGLTLALGVVRNSVTNATRDSIAVLRAQLGTMLQATPRTLPYPVKVSITDTEAMWEMARDYTDSVPTDSDYLQLDDDLNEGKGNN